MKHKIIHEIYGLTDLGDRSRKRIVSSLDSLEIMRNPSEYGFRNIFSVTHVENQRLEIIGEEPPVKERRGNLIMS